MKLRVMVVLYSSAPKSILRTVVSPSALYRGGLWYTGQKSLLKIVVIVCKLEISLAKISHKYVKPLCYGCQFLEARNLYMCYHYTQTKDRRDKKTINVISNWDIFFSLTFFGLKKVAFSFQHVILVQHVIARVTQAKSISMF